MCHDVKVSQTLTFQLVFKLIMDLCLKSFSPLIIQIIHQKNPTHVSEASRCHYSSVLLIGRLTLEMQQSNEFTAGPIAGHMSGMTSNLHFDNYCLVYSEIIKIIRSLHE